MFDTFCVQSTRVLFSVGTEVCFLDQCNHGGVYDAMKGSHSESPKSVDANDGAEMLIYGQ